MTLSKKLLSKKYFVEKAFVEKNDHVSASHVTLLFLAVSNRALIVINEPKFFMIAR